MFVLTHYQVAFVSQDLFVHLLRDKFGFEGVFCVHLFGCLYLLLFGLFYQKASSVVQQNFESMPDLVYAVVC